ncbi:MAG TPA: metalloregulator ArsR/SmtB family transcription factor [Arachnia sp.]|nr:metalloregulator ArsR/SmtB family transcription factor [Arachnia sp.]HMT86669.1 metalloregulator ArsR/SmtB family transcription factor [Arachnia sp.]
MASLDDRVALLKTVADTTRLRILGLIAEQPRTGAELAAELGLTAPTISHHLHRMRDVGIIQAESEGQKRIWSINQQLLDDVHAPALAPTPVDAEQARTLRVFFDGERLRSIPTKRKARVAVLVELLRRFEPGREYTEREVGDILRRAHDDVALLRRELVDYRYLVRADGIYRVNDQLPTRDATEAQEVPAGEAEWFPALLRTAIRH